MLALVSLLIVVVFSLALTQLRRPLVSDIMLPLPSGATVFLCLTLITCSLSLLNLIPSIFIHDHAGWSQLQQSAVQKTCGIGSTMWPTTVAHVTCLTEKLTSPASDSFSSVVENCQLKPGNPDHDLVYLHNADDWTRLVAGLILAAYAIPQAMGLLLPVLLVCRTCAGCGEWFRSHEKALTVPALMLLGGITFRSCMAVLFAERRVLYESGTVLALATFSLVGLMPSRYAMLYSWHFIHWGCVCAMDFLDIFPFFGKRRMMKFQGYGSMLCLDNFGVLAALLASVKLFELLNGAALITTGLWSWRTGISWGHDSFFSHFPAGVGKTFDRITTSVLQPNLPNKLQATHLLTQSHIAIHSLALGMRLLLFFFFLVLDHMVGDLGEVYEHTTYSLQILAFAVMHWTFVHAQRTPCTFKVEGRKDSIQAPGGELASSTGSVKRSSSSADALVQPLISDYVRDSPPDSPTHSDGQYEPEAATSSAITGTKPSLCSTYSAPDGSVWHQVHVIAICSCLCTCSRSIPLHVSCHCGTAKSFAATQVTRGGRVFFFNPTTRDSVWVLPPGCTSGDPFGSASDLHVDERL